MQERRLHARGIRILQARKERGGGCGAETQNRITESATKESREAKRKAKKAIQETYGKTTRRKDKTKTEGEHGERQKGEEKRRRKKKGKETARVSGRRSVDYLGLNGGDAS